MISFPSSATQTPGAPERVKLSSTKVDAESRAIASRLGLADATYSVDVANDARERLRPVSIGGLKVDVPERSRSSILASGMSVDGPLLVTEDYTVLFIAPGWRLSPLRDGDLVATTETRT